MCYFPAVGNQSVTSSVFLLASVLAAAVASSSASASDVVVFDRGGGSERTALARTAAASSGDTVLTPTESNELDVAWAAGCVDVACYSRAGVAGSVDTIILVEAEALTLIDVGAAAGRRRPAPTPAIATVLGRLQERGRWGTLTGPALPAGSVMFVDGTIYDGADLPAGTTRVVIRASDGVLQTVVVMVVADQATVVSLPSTSTPSTSTPSMSTPSTSTPSTSTPSMSTPSMSTPSNAAPGVSPALVTGVVAAGAGVAVVGLVVGLIGEVMAQQALASLQERKPADLGQAETIEIAGFVGAGVGVVALAVGLVLGLGTAVPAEAPPAP